MTKPVNYLTNSLTGLQGEPGVFYNYILAENGLFLQAKNAHLAATVCLAPQLVRGLAPLAESIQLIHGKIPVELLHLATSILYTKPGVEQMLAIVWKDGYSIKIPEQVQQPCSVTYDTVPDAVFEIHSHTGSMPAEFSSIDNHDEQGFHIYAVAGEFHHLFPTITIRLGIYGYFVPVSKGEIFV